MFSLRRQPGGRFAILAAAVLYALCLLIALALHTHPRRDAIRNGGCAVASAESAATRGDGCHVCALARQAAQVVLASAPRTDLPLLARRLPLPASPLPTSRPVSPRFIRGPPLAPLA